MLLIYFIVHTHRQTDRERELKGRKENRLDCQRRAEERQTRDREKERQRDREVRKKEKKKKKKLTAPGIPRRSPIQVLTRPDPA